MRLEAVILPDLGTGPDVPIVVSHWFAARGAHVTAVHSQRRTLEDVFLALTTRKADR